MTPEIFLNTFNVVATLPPARRLTELICDQWYHVLEMKKVFTKTGPALSVTLESNQGEVFLIYLNRYYWNRFREEELKIVNDGTYFFSVGLNMVLKLWREKPKPVEPKNVTQFWIAPPKNNSYVPNSG